MPARFPLALILLAACGSPQPAPAETAETGDAPPDAGHEAWPGRPARNERVTCPEEPAADAEPDELPPKVVPGATIEAQRLSGNPSIEPDEADRAALAKSRKSALVAVKLCVDTAGRVASVRFLQCSGVSGYEDKIRREMKTWTYRPILVEGQAVDVCTVMTFIHRPR